MITAEKNHGELTLRTGIQFSGGERDARDEVGHDSQKVVSWSACVPVHLSTIEEERCSGGHS